MMVSESRRILIVGLGNPGKKYDFTRHNFGKTILYAFANKYHFSFTKERELKGELAKGLWKKKMVFLLFPTTYMNLSGKSVQKITAFYKILLKDVLVISDDIALPFGTLRFRTKGSAGGHNGLKSINESLGTKDYQRLRMGVGEPDIELLENYVLSPFSLEEQKKLPEVISQGINYLEKWLLEKIKECNEERK